MGKFLEFMFVGAVIGVIIGVGYAVIWQNIPVAIGLGTVSTIVGVVLGIVNRAK